MVMVEIKTITDEVKQIDVKRLGTRKCLQLAQKYIPLNALKQKGDGGIEIGEGFNYYGLIEECLGTIPNLNIETLAPGYGNMLFTEYFKGDIFSVLGASNPK